MAVISLYLSAVDLPVHSRIGTQQQLLPGLPPGVEGAGYQYSPEGAVVEHPPVFAGKGNPLGHALVDDVHRFLGQSVHVCFPGAIIAPLDGVVEEPVGTVAVALVILGRIDAPLGCDAVRPPGRILIAECLDVVAQLGQGGGSRTAGQPGTHHNNVDVPFVGGVHQVDLVLMLGPFVGQWAGRDLGVQNSHASSALSG